MNREGIRVTIHCTQLINRIGMENPTVNWYKDGVTITNESAVNAVISNDNRLCIITNTSLAMDGEAGTDGNYTCEVCNSTAYCISRNSTHVVCGKKDYFNNTCIYMYVYIYIIYNYI